MGLHFDRIGSGPPVLLLHPVGLDRTCWAALPERLAATRTVVSVDARGHSRSPPAERPGRMAERVADVVALVEALAMGPAMLVGVSFGGMIAQNVAGTRPDLVDRLVVAGCPLFIPEAAHGAMRQRGADAEAGGMQAVVEATLERWFTADFLSSDVVARVRERLLATAPSGWAAAWEAICEHDARDLLPRFRGETLVIAGEEDKATAVEAMRAIAAAAASARMTVLPGAPHIMQLEAADAFGTLVCDFAAGGSRA